MNVLAKQAVILSRVSSAEQEDGKSLDAQVFNARKYCERLHLEELKVFRIVESSTKGTRKQFQEMLNYVKAQKGTTAIVSDTVDRFQRSFKETLELNPLLDNGQVELHFVANGLVLNQNSPASDRTMWNMCVLMAESYVLQLKDNTKRGLKQKIREGEYPSKAPVGYKNVIINGKKTIVEDPNEAPTVRKMFELYSTGNYSIKTISDMFKAQGIKSERGTYHSISTLSKAIQNPFYYGVMRVKGVEYPHIHGALISKELFDMCQDVRLGYQKKHHNYGCKEFVFRGNITCADCGTLISPYTTVKQTKNGPKKHNYLMCSHFRAKKEGFTCTTEQIPEQKALEQVQAALQKITIAPEVLEAILEDLRTSTQADVALQQKSEASAKQRISQINTQRDSLFAMHAAGNITVEYLNGKLKELKDEEKKLKALAQNKAQQTQEAAYNVERLLKLVNKLPELFAKSSKVEEKRAIINLVLSNLRLKGKNLEIFYKKPFSLLAEGSKCFVWGG